MTTWIFVRGLTREARHWGDFARVFERVVPGSRVVAVDLPGNGALNDVASPGDVPAMAEHCRATLARLGIAPPYALLAMSLGAMVAIAWAHGHPQEVSRCVVINTSVRPFSAFYRRLRPRNYLPLLRLALPGRGAREWEESILAMTSRLRQDRVTLVDEWVAIRRSRPVSRGNALRQLRAAARYRAPAGPPAAAMLILASRHDALVDVDCSHALARAWGCELAIHPQAGHDLPLDDGDWVARQVRDWIGRTPRLADEGESPPARHEA